MIIQVDMMPGHQLKLCPFCNSTARLFMEEDASFYFVGCVDEHSRCTVASSTKPATSGEEAMKFWNVRKTIILSH
jgi:hypothetical protein